MASRQHTGAPLRRVTPGNAGWLLAALTLATLAGCASFPPAEHKPLRFAENMLGTNREELEWNFHSLLEYRSTDNEVPTSLSGSSSRKQSAVDGPDFCALFPGRSDAEVRLRGLGLQFPGYLLGIEKTRRQVLGLEGGSWSGCDEPSTATIFEQSFLRAPAAGSAGYDESTCFMKRRLDDGTRMFLSHVAAFRSVPDSSAPRIGGHLLYDVYDRNDLLCSIQQAKAESRPVRWQDGAYRAGRQDGIAALKKALLADIENPGQRGAPYSHVFIYVMGWNTGEREAVENFNNLYGYLLDAAAADGNAGGRFRPLFVGITWPSAWSFGTSAWDTLVRASSFWNKKNDADELGATWVNYLLNEMMAEIKHDHPSLRVVLVGHSFGARVASRTLYSCDLLPDPSACHQTADLLVGLQSAFGRSRFRQDLAPSWQEALLIHPLHHEGLPYTDFSDYRRLRAKQVYLWSRYDSATSTTAMMGGANDVERTRCEQHRDLFQHLPAPEALIECQANGGPSRPLPDQEPYNPHLAAARSDELIGLVGGLDAKDRRVLLLDGAGFVRHDAPYHGGGAHSDIYNRETGRLTWELIKKFAPVP